MNMAKRKQSIPGHFTRRITAVVREPGKDQVGDDGRPMAAWYQSGDMVQETVYNAVLERLDGRFSLSVQWVDISNEGHRYRLPHELILKLVSASKAIMAEARSERAQHGAETRRQRQADLSIVDEAQA